MVGENPVLIDNGGHFHGVSRREDRPLEDSAGVDEDLPSQGVDVHRVPEMRV